LKPDAKIDEHLGRRLRRRRMQLGLTQGEVGHGCGVGFRQIQKYECGAAGISAPRLWRLADLLGVTVSYFFQDIGRRAVATGGPADLGIGSETAELLRLVNGLSGLDRGRLLEQMRTSRTQPAASSSVAPNGKAAR